MAIDPTAVQGVTSGTITLPANTPSNLYSLITAQLSNACPASATEVQIYADAAQIRRIRSKSARSTSPEM